MFLDIAGRILLQGSDALSVRKRLVAGTLLNLVATAFNQGSTLAINIIVARMLGQEGFGQYALVLSTLFTAAFVAQIATGSTAVKYVAEFRSTDPSRAGRIVGLCALVTLVTSGVAFLGLLLGADWLARVAMKEPSLAFALRLGAAFVIFNCLNFYQMGALAGLESYPALARTGMVGGLAAVSVSVPITWVFGLSGAVFALVLAALLRWGVCAHALRRETRRQGIAVAYRGAWRERAILGKFAMPAALSGFLTMPATWLANLFLIQQPNGFSQNAFYNAAMNLKTIVMFLSNNVNSVGMSLLSNQKGLNDRRRYRQLYFANIAICTALMLVAGGVVLLGGRYLLRLYGEHFDSALPVLTILLLTALVETVSLSIYQIVQSHGRMWVSFWAVSLPISICLPVLSYFWSPLHGALGLAMSLAVATVFHLVMTCVVAFPVARKLL